MGGEGSGRRPSVETLLRTQTVVANAGGDDLQLPNLSGVKTPALITSAGGYLKNTGDTGTGNYIITQTGTDPERIQTTDRNGVVKARLGYIASSGLGPGQIYLYNTSGAGSAIINGGTGNSYLNGLGGNVGVGTTIPLNILEVSGSASQFSVTNAGTSVLQVSGSNVGIGTTSPNVKLDILSGVSSLPAVSGTSQTGAFRIGGTAGTTTVLDMGIYNSIGTTWLQATDSGDLSQTYKLGLNPNGGNVGIGTTSPQGLLHISGGAILVKDVSAPSAVSGSITIFASGGQVWAIGGAGTPTKLANA